jgi:hypothetical protein
VRLVHERPGACGFLQHLPALAQRHRPSGVGLDGCVFLGLRDDPLCLLAGGAKVLIGHTARFLPDPVGFLLGLTSVSPIRRCCSRGALEVLRELTDFPLELRALPG